MLQKINYRPIIENGVLTGVKRNSIVLSDESMTGFDEATKSKTEKEIGQLRRMAHHVIVNDGTIINMIKQLDRFKKEVTWLI